MSKLIYNGIEFGYVQSQSLEEAPQLDPSGSDQVYTAIRLRVTAVLTGYVPGPNHVPPALAGEDSAAAVLKRLQHELALPRRPLLYERNGVKLIDLPGGRDDATGPVPYGVTVGQVAEGAYVVNWGVELRLNQCDKNSPSFVPLVLSNRWSETATINEKWLTTKRRRGRLVLSGRAGKNPDDYRALCTPPAEPGFVRTQAEYALTENGLEAAYAFTDEEQMVMPPYPAIKASGRQVETAAMPGAVRYGQLELRLEGPKGVNKQDLLKSAIRIGMSRALSGGLKPVPGNDGKPASYLIGGAVAEELFDNVIELQMRWLVQADDRREGPKKNVFGGVLQAVGVGLLAPPVGAAVIGGKIEDAIQAIENPEGAGLIDKGDPRAGLTTPKDWVGKAMPGVNKDRALAPPTRGTAETLGLIAALLKDPCLQETLRPQPDKKNQAVGVYAKARVFRVPKLPAEEDEAALYQDDTPGSYEHFSCVCHFTHDEGKHVLISTAKDPVTKKMIPHPVVQVTNETLALVVEMTAKRVGGPPVLPNPRKVPKVQDHTGKDIDDPVYLGGTVSPAMIDLAADGVSTVHTVSAVYRYKYRLPCEANITSPLPPFLRLNLKAEARLAASLASGEILFLNAPPPAGGKNTNIFCGKGITELGTAELVGFPGTPRPS